MRRPPIILALLWLTVACAATPRPVPPPTVQVRPAPAPAPTPQTWRDLATRSDRDAIDALPARWSRALAGVPRAKLKQWRSEGALADSRTALDAPAMSPGPYHCRLVRLGGKQGATTYLPEFCYVNTGDAGLSLTKQTGSYLFGGWVHADTDTRQIFLGGSRVGKAAAPAYGTATARDVAGVVERVSPFRWRLVIARAGNRGLLSVYELVPITPQVPGAKPAVPAERR